MNRDRVGSGNDVVNETNIAIEIPARQDPLTYEVDEAKQEIMNSIEMYRDAPEKPTLMDA